MNSSASYVPALGRLLLGAIFLIAGYQARFTALTLAVFAVVAGVFFHNDFADQNQFIHFLKNLALAGGLLQVVAFGAGRLSVDGRKAAAAEALAA